MGVPGVECVTDDCRANVKSEPRDVGVTCHRYRRVQRRSGTLGRREVADIIIIELDVAAHKLGDGSGEASGHVVQDLVDGEKAAKRPALGMELMNPSAELDIYMICEELDIGRDFPSEYAD